LQRQATCRSGCGDAGNRIDPLGAVVNDLRDSGGLEEPLATNGHRHGEDVVRVEARIDRLQFHKRANEERRSDDEYKRESHLADDQEGTHLAAAEADAGTIAAFVQDCGQILARGSNGRDQAKQDSGEY